MHIICIPEPLLHSGPVIVEDAGVLQAYHLPETSLRPSECHPVGSVVIRRGFPVVTDGIRKVSDSIQVG